MLNVVGPYFCFTFSPGWCNGSDAAGYNVEFAQYQDCPWCTYNENEPVYGGAWSMPNQGVCTNSRYDQTRCGYVDPYNYGWINITVGGTGHSTFVNSCAQGWRITDVLRPNRLRHPTGERWPLSGNCRNMVHGG